MKNSLVTLFVLLELRGVALTACPGHDVQISGVAGGVRNYYHEIHRNLLPAVYGEDVEIYCSGPLVNHLTISLNGAGQTAEAVNSTTVKITLIKPEVRSHIYDCADVENDCTTRLTVVVMPAIDVLSTNVRKERLNGKLYFFVAVNEDYELVCSSDPADSLIIFKDDLKEVQTHVVNETTIKTKKLRETENVYNDYYCYPEDSYYFVEIQSPVRVYVDYPPEATNFWCVESNEQVECSWNVFSKYTMFKLLYKDQTGKFVSVCEDFSSRQSRLCEWPLAGVRSQGMDVTKEMVLVLQACGHLFCTNQTFHINRKEIRKPPPPHKLRVKQIGEWISVAFGGDENDCYGVTPVHIARYVMPGMGLEERYISAASVSTTNMVFRRGYTTMRFSLPCPDTLYIIKVYVKCSGTPWERRYESEPASVVFHTSPGNYSDPIDPMCNMESNLINTGDRALYQVEIFARYFQTYESAYRKKVDALKRKRAKVEAMRTQL